MFESLSDKILGSLKKLKGGHKITESNVEEVIKEIRLSLLDADVNFKVVKKFIDEVKQKAIGEKVIENVNPGQMFVKIVHDELVKTLGGGASEIIFSSSAEPTVVFLVGLQGAGKTTSAAKLALFLRTKKQKKVGLVPADVYRPAAIDQLQTLGKQNNFPTFSSQVGQRPQDILTQSKAWAKEQQLDVVIVDTAGRLTIDEALMSELSDLKTIWAPQEILLVADAMLGQQSVQVAEGFHQRLGLTGLILTKVDGDARGGAALSIREVTGIPIKFLGVGEKVSALEIFHPDRLAGRILDMGDVLSLVEKAQEVMDEKLAQKSTERLLKNEFSLEDFLAQIQQMKKLGGIETLLKFLPGMGEISKQLKTMAPPDQEMKKIEAIIHSMTNQERRNHKVLNGSRRLRIAKGSGTQVSDVNKLIKQFEEAQKMMSQFMKMGLGSGMGRPGSGKRFF
ncbi:MAG: signal recognition particle protein [Bdellovibrionaceae bacterium]|nr:signal recognition particle protein [Pseudobdellovibrionaceae bacterium]NUM59330.1 signal recognition particle protein [Pseudobdellovibrionaceae bacterium]